MAIFRRQWKSLPCKYRDKAVIFAKNLVNWNFKFVAFCTLLSRNESHFFMFDEAYTTYSIDLIEGNC